MCAKFCMNILAMDRFNNTQSIELCHDNIFSGRFTRQTFTSLIMQVGTLSLK